MRKLIYLLTGLATAITGIPATQAGTEQAVRRYDTSALRSEDVTAEGVQYMRLSWVGLEMTASPGEPELPVEYVRFLVPVYTTNFTATVSGVSHGSTLQTMYRIYPGQQPVTTNHEGPVPFTAPLDTMCDRYYIITPRSLADSFRDLAAWKRQKGYDVVTKTIEAMKTVNVNRSCIIDEGGVLTIAGDETVTLNCTVKRGGKLKVTAKSIQTGSGFTVEPGETLDIQYK